MSLNDALRFKQEAEKGFERFEEVIRGVLVAVDDPDSAAVSGQPGRVWVQLYGEEESPPVPIFNREVPTIPDTPVLVKRSPKAPFGYEIVSWEAKEEITRADGYVHTSFRNPHAREHEIGGRDPLFIYLRALTMLRCSPTGSGFKVSVPPTNYPTGLGTLARFPGHNSFDLAAHQPASGSACLVLVYLDTATNSLASVAGADAPDTEAIIPPKPAIPEDAIPSTYVRLSGAATRLFETDVIDDTRAFVNTLTHNAAKIRGYRVETGTPANGEYLAWNSSSEEIEWTLPTKLVAPDGSPNPALSVDNAGDTTAAGNILLASGKDVFPGADGGGLFQRSVNHWISPTDHFNTFSGWTWSSVAPHDGAASTIDVASFPSILRLINDSTTEDHFAYQTATSSTTLLIARLTKGVDSYVGIRLDDGSDNNYFEVRLVGAASATGMFAIEVHNRVGGGAVTTTTRLDPIPAAFYTFRISRAASSPWTGISYYTTNTPLLVALGVSTGSVTWVPSRAGIIFGQRNTASSSDRAGLLDWWFSN